MGKAVPFKLHRGNLAMNFCMALNLNIFLELPRQQFKTVSAAVRYLYVFNFGTTNSKIGFFHKNMEGAKDNLQTLKDIRDLLPDYLIMKEGRTIDGKILRGSNTVESMKNPINNNMIKAFPSATNKAKAASLARGKSLTGMWFDEYGFLVYNDIVFMNAMPAFKTAADNARANGSPYGILITTTPGFMTEDCGREAFAMKEAATKFDEQWYDFTYAELMDLLKANTSSDFVYIKYTYQQLGKDEAWFNEICKLLKNSWGDIRREILLEWATGVENSPFREEDLDTISRLIVNPISTVYIFGKYRFDTYLQTDTIMYPPIMGVDVSGGLKKDSSTITIIDSRTTKVLGCMNCNYISTNDLAKVIYFITTNWMNNVVINVERNGGFGLTVISRLIKMGIKRNLYYEIKDVVVEERQDGVHAYKQKVRKKVYGTNSDHRIRQVLIDILLERVENHKDKIISPIIYEELLGMEIKRNGKVEHSNSTHDDQVFSMLLALYVWYEGVNLMERFGIKKTSIRTDEDIDEEIYGEAQDTVEVIDSFTEESEVDKDIAMSLEEAIRAGGIPLKEFLDKRREEEDAIYKALLQTPLGEKAYRDTYNIPKEAELNLGGGNLTNIPDSVFSGFYSDKVYTLEQPRVGTSGPIINTFNMMDTPPGSFDDEEYKYEDHFNF